MLQSSLALHLLRSWLLCGACSAPSRSAILLDFALLSAGPRRVFDVCAAGQYANCCCCAPAPQYAQASLSIVSAIWGERIWDARLTHLLQPFHLPGLPFLEGWGASLAFVAST